MFVLLRFRFLYLILAWLYTGDGVVNSKWTLGDGAWFYSFVKALLLLCGHWLLHIESMVFSSV